MEILVPEEHYFGNYSNTVENLLNFHNSRFNEGFAAAPWDALLAVPQGFVSKLGYFLTKDKIQNQKMIFIFNFYLITYSAYLYAKYIIKNQIFAFLAVLILFYSTIFLKGSITYAPRVSHFVIISAGFVIFTEYITKPRVYKMANWIILVVISWSISANPANAISAYAFLVITSMLYIVFVLKLDIDKKILMRAATLLAITIFLFLPAFYIYLITFSNHPITTTNFNTTQKVNYLNSLFFGGAWWEEQSYENIKYFSSFEDLSSVSRRLIVGLLFIFSLVQINKICRIQLLLLMQALGSLSLLFLPSLFPFLTKIPFIEMFYIPFREPWAKFDQGYVLYMSTYLSFSILKHYKNINITTKFYLNKLLILIFIISFIYLITPIFNKNYLFDSTDTLINDEVIIFEELSIYAVNNNINCFFLDIELPNADKTGKMLDLFLTKNIKIISPHLYPMSNSNDLKMVVNEFCSDKIIYILDKVIKNRSFSLLRYKIRGLYFYTIDRELIDLPKEPLGFAEMGLVHVFLGKN